MKPVHNNEEARLRELRSYNILDTPREKEFDELAHLAAFTCTAPVSLVSLVDRDRQWHKAQYGIEVVEVPRRVSFCSHAIQQAPAIMEVPDATADPRFRENEFVVSGPQFRYYAGAPLVTPSGAALGTLCVFDRRARELSLSQKEALQILSRQVMTHLEIRRDLAELNETARTMQGACRGAPAAAPSGSSAFSRTVRELNDYALILREQNLRLELLNDASRQLLAGHHPDEMVREIYARIAEHFQIGGLVEFAVTNGSEALEIELVLGPKLENRDSRFKLGVGQGVAGLVAATRQPQVFNHVLESGDPRLRVIQHFGARAFACYPLVVGDRLLGTFGIGTTERDSFSAEDQRFFQTLASEVALAKDRSRLVREMEQHTAALERTVEERTASLREMLAELRHMSYSMVHELRAPLRAISAFAHLLEVDAGEQLASGASDYLRRIQDSAGRMDRLVRETLNYTKLLQEHPRLGPVDPAPVLESLVQGSDDLQPPHAQVTLQGPFPAILAHEGLLRQCLSHLLRNAVQHGVPGRLPQVTVCAQSSPDKVQVCVSDNGRGISPDRQEAIFQLFERDHPSTAAAGVGLAIVRKSMERMKGRIWVESEEGQGSRFWLEFHPA